MKKQLKTTYTYFISAALVMMGATSCQKDISGTAAVDAIAVTTSTSSTIAVAANGGTGTTGGSTTTDSVLVIHKCEKGQHRDSVASSALPATVQAYLAANYSGYTFHKAFAVKDTTGAVKGYVVIIHYNNKPIATLFTADGTFVKILEQREKGDQDGDGWHRGGRFDNRDGQHRDTLALTALSSVITTYFSANFATDTLTKAFINKDGSVLVISKNNGAYATLFTSTGVFVKRVALPLSELKVKMTDLAQSALPSNVLSYLSATYPNYVFDKADSVTLNTVLKGYIVIINSNNTRYCVAFDANGNFVAAKAIW